MNGKLRNVVSGVEPARFAPDLLPEPVGVEQFVCTDCDRVEPVEQSEFGEFLDGMRQRVDAHTEFADGVCLLIDFAVDAACVQHERGHKAADACARNDGLHGISPRINFAGRMRYQFHCSRMTISLVTGNAVFQRGDWNRFDL